MQTLAKGMSVYPKQVQSEIQFKAVKLVVQIGKLKINL